MILGQDAPGGAFTLQGSFEHVDGHQWLATLCPEGLEPSDTIDAPAASSLALFEDGVALGPRHAFHSDISQLGGGRYSHWCGALRFSTSDGSNPNENGRHYAVALQAPALRLLALGSCNLAQAVMRLHGRDGIRNVWPDAKTSYSLREHRQLLRHYTGRALVQERLQPYTVAARLLPAGVGDGSVDVLFLELGSCIDIAFDGAWLARSELLRGIVENIALLGPMQSRTAYRWYNQGLIRQCEAVREACVLDLINALPAIDIDRPLAREILLGARGDMQDMADQRAALEEIRDMVRPRAICVVSAQNAYTPDGRPLSWPVNYPRQLDALCAAAEVALLHPSDLVAQHGAAFSLSPDGKHFTEGFIGVLAQAMLDRAHQALGTSALDTA